MKKVMIYICFTIFFSSTAINAGWQKWFDTLFGMKQKKGDAWQTTTSIGVIDTTPSEFAAWSAVDRQDLYMLESCFKNGYHAYLETPKSISLFVKNDTVIAARKIAKLAIEFNKPLIVLWLLNTYGDQLFKTNITTKRIKELACGISPQYSIRHYNKYDSPVYLSDNPLYDDLLGKAFKKASRPFLSLLIENALYNSSLQDVSTRKLDEFDRVFLLSCGLPFQVELRNNNVPSKLAPYIKIQRLLQMVSIDYSRSHNLIQINNDEASQSMQSIDDDHKQLFFNYILATTIQELVRQGKDKQIIQPIIAEVYRDLCKLFPQQGAEFCKNSALFKTMFKMPLTATPFTTRTTNTYNDIVFVLQI